MQGAEAKARGGRIAAEAFPAGRKIATRSRVQKCGFAYFLSVSMVNGMEEKRRRRLEGNPRPKVNESKAARYLSSVVRD